MKKSCLILVIVLLVFSGAAFANLTYRQPASVLVYPFFNDFPGIAALMTITNMNSCFEVKPGSSHFFGDVYARIYYVAGDDCDISDRVVFLTPGDTIIINVADHNPEYTLNGWVWVVAMDPDTQAPLKYDGLFQAPSGNVYESGLIGKMQIANGIGSQLFSIPAIGLRAYSGIPYGDPLDWNGNSTLQLGQELEKMPSALYISDFTEIDYLNADTYLCLLTFQPHNVRVDVDYFFFNNDEVMFNNTKSFRCWTYQSLASINAVARNLNGVPALLPTGWVKMEVSGGQNTVSGQQIPADEIPILGAVIYTLVKPAYITADLLHHSGDASIGGGLQYF